MNTNLQSQAQMRTIASATLPIYPDLADKVAIITGSSRGIGATTARLLAANGVKVVVNGRDQKAIDAVVDDIHTHHGEAMGVRADVTDFEAIERMRQTTLQTFGPIDILVVFAGGGRARPGPITQLSIEDWHSTIDANLTSTFLALKSFLPGMIERGRGAIITMASLAARIPTPAPAPYAAAKAAIIMLTHQVAAEVGKHGIRVNCVSPSTILTEQTLQYLTEERHQEWTALHPLGRLGTPEDVALSTLFLASESASWLTGQTIDVAGGRFMQ